MCGIFGLVALENSGVSRPDWEQAIANLFILSETRGKEAAGVAIASQNQITVHKDAISASNMLQTKEYKGAVERGVGQYFKGFNGALGAIGHSRLVTNGMQGIDTNNQPVRTDGTVLVHNGIITNVDEIWASYPGITRTADVDSELLSAIIAKHRAKGASPAKCVKEAFKPIYGETSIAVFFDDLNVLALGTNTGSMYIMVSDDKKQFVFTSEHYMSTLVKEGKRSIPGFENAEIRQMDAGAGLILDMGTLEEHSFKIKGSGKAPALAPTLASTRAIETKEQRYRDAIDSMQRCTKCILPETMPYIEFDTEGVCNYCHAYKPIKLEPAEALEAKLEKYRTPGSRYDCMMAFSGGRDSSMGMHLLKEKYGMNPVAFSYDWGMVTDLGRRNQSRMCAALGIEHIWVSADIKKKRGNIRRNVTAWMKQPDIGIIPLFIAGDKHTFVESNRVMDETGMELAVYAPNKHEKTEFKTGFCGIAPDPTENQPFALSSARKLKLAKYYGTRFATNPRYINRSMMDTFTGFQSLYYKARDYLYLFDYIPWDEDEIDDVLINTYGWEQSHETPCTWRIGDGTAPFYNYVYHTVCGFTEHDTFRSNQIREGQLTRDQGLELIARDNQPRWDGFREYCSLINVDFDELVRCIDQIDKLYIN